MSEPDQPSGTAHVAGVPETPETGEPRVDRALQEVADLDDVPVDGHAERLSAAHAALQEVLRQPADPEP